MSKKEEIEIDIDDEVFIVLAKLAHERNITFNDLIVSILEDKLKSENSEDFKANYFKSLDVDIDVSSLT